MLRKVQKIERARQQSLLKYFMRQSYWIEVIVAYKKTSAIWSIKEACFESGTEYIRLTHARQN